MANITTNLQKLELLKISDTYEDFRIGNLSNKVLLDELLKILLHVINRKDINKVELENISNKIIEFLNNLILDDDKLKNLRISKNISNAKEYVITKIKNYSKEERKENELVQIYKNITNELEKIEIAILVDKVTTTNLTNYNIINYLIFDDKILSRSIFLIEHFPYFINIYNLTGNNILLKIIENVISILNNYDTYKTNPNKEELFYYDNILNSLLSTEKIDLNKNELNKVLSLLKKEKVSSNKKIKTVWLDYFINIIENNDYCLDIKTINDMYNIRKVKDYDVMLFDYSKLYQLNYNIEDYCITIDGDNTIDRDDALEIKKLDNGNYLLKVIIADPNSLFNVDSEIIKNAINQGESIYYKDSTIHMFSELIVKSFLSLDENRRRLARVYNYEIDNYGNIINFKITKELVCVKKNLTYDQVDYIIKHSSNNKNIENIIGNALDLNAIIKKKYDGVNLNEERDKCYSSSSSNLLVSTIMTFNNYQVAKYFKDNNLPFVYKAHIEHKELNNLKIYLETLKEKEKYEYERLIKSLEGITLTSFYTIDSIPHDALNLECYGSTTAPGRRAADIIANDCQDKLYFDMLTDKEFYKYEDWLNHQVKLLNMRKLEIAEHYKKLSRY